MLSSFGCSRACKPCGGQEKTHNTVKVDAASVAAALVNGKENAAPGNNGNFGNDGAQPVAIAKEEQDRIQKQWEAKQAEARRVEEQRREMAARVKEEQERRLEEQRRQEAELQRQRLEKEQRERLIAEEKMRRQQEEEERQRAEEERLRQQEGARRRQEEEKAQLAEKQRMVENDKKVRAWLCKNGFKDVNDLVRKRLSKVRPLHVVVNQNDFEMATLLKEAGADVRLTSGKNETPTQLAQRLNKNGSHTAIICALSA